MIANYHAHTPLCRHARGAETEYVEKAIERGLKLFGFSDHTPQYFPCDYYSTMRMFPDELPEYCDTVRSLQAQFKGKIQIPLGLEVEYYPLTWKELLPRLQDVGMEYMILGQHWVGNEFDAPYNGRPTEDVSQLIRYCDQVITAMDTGKFTYLAHPDVINFSGDRKTYETQMRRICKASKDTDTPLEINFLGLNNSRHYPNPLFWQLVGEEGCQVVFGIDAHSPEEVLNQKPEEIALSMVEKFGLTLLETVPLKKI